MTPWGGYSEPHEFVPALARRCRDLGVEIRENAPVSGLQIENGRVVGAQTGMGVLEADLVVCTVHAWTTAFMELCGVRLPIKSFVHQRYVSSKLQEYAAIPAINANPYGGYIRPARLGTTDYRILAGGETEDREEERVDDLAFHMSGLAAPQSLRRRLSENLAPLVPKLAATHWESEQVGLISFSLDGEPILGKLPQLPGLVVGAAFHSGGVRIQPGCRTPVGRAGCRREAQRRYFLVFTHPVCRGGFGGLPGRDGRPGRCLPSAPLEAASTWIIQP